MNALVRAITGNAPNELIVSIPQVLFKKTREVLLQAAGNSRLTISNILLMDTVLFPGDGKKVAIVIYNSIPDAAGRSRKISRNIEKGLRFTDEKDLKNRLDQAVFLDELGRLGTVLSVPEPSPIVPLFSSLNLFLTTGLYDGIAVGKTYQRKGDHP